MKLILASASPRRRELLNMVTTDFSVEAAVGDEVTTETLPHKVVMQLAYNKAKEVAGRHPHRVVLGCDTVVVHDGHILGKPHSKQQAYDMLSSLSGNVHEVYTGVALVCDDKSMLFYDRSEVVFHTLTKQQIDSYIATGSPMDKAGAYGIQDSGFVSRIEGSYYNVVGLPVELICNRLQEFLDSLNTN